MRGALPVHVLVAITVLATGCVTPDTVLDTARPDGDVTVPPFALGRVVDVRVPVNADGVTLAGTVFLPDVPGADRFPVILDYGPYFGHVKRGTREFDPENPPDVMFAHFLKHGYAIAVVNARGTGESQGCFTFGGDVERADIAATVEWLAREPWSDGNVAVVGSSYEGGAAWEAAVAAPPSLKAVVPVSALSDWYRLMFADGVAFVYGPSFPTRFTVETDLAYEPSHVDGFRAWLAAQPSNICPDVADVAFSGYRTFAEGGTHDAFWDERDNHARLGNVTVPALFVQGVRDVQVFPDHAQYLWPDLPGVKRFVLGQWGHGVPWWNAHDRDLDWAGFNATVLTWLDAFVREDPVARERALATAPVRMQAGDGAWWNFTEWPPRNATPTRVHLTPSRTLATETPAGEGEHVITPGDFVLIEGQNAVAAGVFRTPVLDAPLHLAGNPEVTLTVTPHSTEGHASVLLIDHPEGESPLLNAEIISRGWRDFAHRDSRDARNPVTPGEPMTLTVRLHAVSHIVQPGHRLLLAVLADDVIDLQQAGNTASFTLSTGSDRAFLTAPVLEGEWPDTEDAARRVHAGPSP